MFLRYFVDVFCDELQVSEVGPNLINQIQVLSKSLVLFPDRRNMLIKIKNYIRLKSARGMDNSGLSC